MARQPRKKTLLCFASGVILLLVIATANLHTFSRFRATVAWPDNLRRPHVSDTSDGEAQLHHSNWPQLRPEEIEEDHNGLRTLLFPQKHIYRDPETIRLQWNVTVEQRSPDGVNRPVYLINGLFPGPTIEARSGDTLEIEVNSHTANGEGISFHWHGLTMKGANEMDGVVGLTQCEISRSQTFTYRFRIDDSQSGTFWYHAHSSVHRADGLYGGLVVHEPVRESQAGDSPARGHDVEQLLLIGDWYHRPAKDVLGWFQNFSHFGNDPAPDSLLINGRGYFNCSMAVKARPVDCTAVERPQLKLYGERVRLRVVNTGALTGFTLAVPDDSMKVIEVDGGNPVAEAQSAKSVGVLYPGGRMDIVVRRRSADSANVDSTSELVVALDRETLKFKNFALTPHQSFPLIFSARPSHGPAASQDNNISEPELSHFDLSKAVGPNLDGIIPESPSERAVFYTRIEILASHRNVPLGVVNHTSWVVSNPDTLPLLALDRDQWAGMRHAGDPPPHIGEIARDVPWYRDSGEDKWMDIVLNNLDEKGHPFHLHGYSFYLVSSHRSATGLYEAYNPFDVASPPAGGPMNTANPLRKDTVYVPRMGYVVLRFPLDNDGLWLLHCHALWHQAAGMGIALQIGDGAAPEDVKRRAGELCSA